MGVRHLRKIEQLLKNYPNKYFSRTEIKDTLKINYKTVIESLGYFMRIGLVVKKNNRYRWK